MEGSERKRVEMWEWKDAGVPCASSTLSGLRVARSYRLGHWCPDIRSCVASSRCIPNWATTRAVYMSSFLSHSTFQLRHDMGSSSLSSQAQLPCCSSLEVWASRCSLAQGFELPNVILMVAMPEALPLLTFIWKGWCWISSSVTQCLSFGYLLYRWGVLEHLMC